MKASTKTAIGLLCRMIEIPSLSRKEDVVADMIEAEFKSRGWRPNRIKNNIWVQSKNWEDGRITCLLNSHIDTVKPSKSYTYDPYIATKVQNKIIGLGSNDAGASVVSLMAAFEALQDGDLPFNLVLLISAEEEISGKNGVELALTGMPPIDFGIIGEPTNKHICIAEKGLVVLDGKSKGVTGHAARDVGENALYLAIQDIEIIRQYDFDRVSEVLGKTKATVTQIQSGSQHNVIPDECTYVVDVRTNELYSNQEVVDLLNEAIEGQLTPRSTRLNSSKMEIHHPVVLAANQLGIPIIGSATMSDQALMSFPTVKMGPGDSPRSHTADEYIYISEIEEGIEAYIHLLKTIKF